MNALRLAIHAIAIALNGALTFFIVINMPPLQILVSRLTESGGVLGLVYILTPIVSLIALVWSWKRTNPKPSD